MRPVRFELLGVILCVASLAAGGCGPQVEESPQNAAKGPQAEPRPSEGSGSAARYRVNSAKSRFTAHVGVGGLLAAAGHPHTIALRDFDGDVQADGDKLESASVRIRIKTESLGEVGKEFDEKEREKVNREVHGEALETSKYPEIVFKGQAVSVRQVGEGQYEATLKGELSLHGVTHQISFPVKVRREQRSLRASGEFTILHSDYNPKRLSAAGGTVKATDEIQLSFDLQADGS